MNPAVALPNSDLTFPLRVTSSEEFSRAASALRRPEFSQSSVQLALHALGFRGLEAELAENQDPSTGSSENTLVKLFIRLESVPQKTLQELLDDSSLDALRSLDLVRVGPSDESSYYSPVFLYPVGDFMIASDHHTKAGGLLSDGVFPAVEPGAVQFLKLLPNYQVGDALDLCSGTGIGAFVLSRHATHVLASDITARSTHFAVFNQRLNSCENVEVVQGDLYQGVEGRTFDFIAAHAPCLPSLTDVSIWRDAGPTGEALLKRIVGGLPQFLQPNGQFLALCVGSDTDKIPYQERVRLWLGEYQDHFDIILAAKKYLSPQQLAREIAQQQQKQDSGELAQQMENVFAETGTTRFVYGALALRRHGHERRRPQTFRTQLSTKSDGNSFRWFFDWNARSAQTDLTRRMSGLRLSLSPDLVLRTTHTVKDGQLIAAEQVLETTWPFSHDAKAEPGIVPLLCRFDGRTTVAQAYKAARRDRAVPSGFELENFVALLAAYIGRGYLSIPEGDLERVFSLEERQDKPSANSPK